MLCADRSWIIDPSGWLSPRDRSLSRHCSRQSSYRAQAGRNCYVCHTVCLKAAGHSCTRRQKAGGGSINETLRNLLFRVAGNCFSKTRASPNVFHAIRFHRVYSLVASPPRVPPLCNRNKETTFHFKFTRINIVLRFFLPGIKKHVSIIRTFQVILNA